MNKIIIAEPGDKLQVVLEKGRNHPEYEKEGLRIKIEELQCRVVILEKRWKSVRKWIKDNPTCSMIADYRSDEILDAMTEITRKIK